MFSKYFIIPNRKNISIKSAVSDIRCHNIQITVFERMRLISKSLTITCARTIVLIPIKFY